MLCHSGRVSDRISLVWGYVNTVVMSVVCQFLSVLSIKSGKISSVVGVDGTGIATMSTICHLSLFNSSHNTYFYFKGDCIGKKLG